ncbi:hypothetical protein F4604DRAFT_1935464 [Suillus subluteus]|nr:hypothetical protein F4604DRAFT_1935464 [Suillus subluteus]
MSLKQDRRNRPWIGRFLASFRRVFMSEPPPGLPALKFHYPNGLDINGASVLSWCSSMTDSWDETQGNLYAKCVLARMEYYKCAGHPEHEFLLFYLRHWIAGCSAQAVVSADRAVRRQGRSLKQSSELVSPSSSGTNAYDSVSIYAGSVPLTFIFCALGTSSVHRPVSGTPPGPGISFVRKPMLLVFERKCENHLARARYRGVALGSPTEDIEAQKMLETLEQVKCHHEAEEAKNRQKLRMEFEVENELFRQAQQAEIERLRQTEICTQAENAQQKAEIERVRREKDAEIEQVRPEKEAEIEQLHARLAASEG